MTAHVATAKTFKGAETQRLMRARALDLLLLNGNLLLRNP